MRSSPALLLLVLQVATAGAQATQATPTDRAARFMDNCRDNRSDNRETFCETRDVSVPTTADLSVDGRQNGGVTVHGWDKPNIQVVAMIQAQAETQEDARAMAKDITISTNDGELRADGPSTRRRDWWSVSFEVWVPKHTNLSLRARNGGIEVENVDSRMDLNTENGGLRLRDVAGDVHGETTNGGVTAELSGDKWSGAGLDVRTTNGGVHLYIPDNYSARLETGTVNGGMDIGFPITVQGSLNRRLSTQLGSGGPTIRATTTNGGVSIRRR